MQRPGTFDRGDGVALAVSARPGSGPALIFVPGYASDMTGAKADAVDGWAAAHGRACTRFDYSGCGASGGAFTDGTIGRWLADSEAVLAQHPGPVVLVGSSMGGWIALLLALAHAERIAGLVLIAPAPDFTQWGLADTLTSDERASLLRSGRFERPSPYAPQPTVYTRALIEDGAARLLLGRPLPYAGPVRILHGQADPDVPWRLSLDLAERLASSDVRLTLVKDGDHRLSRPSDLALLADALASL
ncbi:MAG: alpha/beta hydrolase [Sphingomonadaceae bacterium]|nr:alpha/beta hydrolase [Sphingomonadaceae bacterium]